MIEINNDFQILSIQNLIPKNNSRNDNHFCIKIQLKEVNMVKDNSVDKT